jgi:uridine kinase
MTDQTYNKINHNTQLTAFKSSNAEILEKLSSRIIAMFGGPPLMPRRIIAIAGAGCLGKSTLAEVLISYLEKLALYDCNWVDLDGYLIEKTWRESFNPIITGYNPKGYELQKAEKDLSMWLKTGKSFPIKIYDKLKSERTESRVIKAKDLLIVEGVLGFYKSLQRISTFKIFLHASKEIQYINRLDRERNHLDRTKEQIKQKFRNLYPDYEKYILPTMRLADVIFKVERGYKLSTEGV